MDLECSICIWSVQYVLEIISAINYNSCPEKEDILSYTWKVLWKIEKSDQILLFYFFIVYSNYFILNYQI